MTGRGHPLARSTVRAIHVLLIVVVTVAPVAAQTAAEAPVAPGRSWVTLGGELTAVYGSDDPGFFNYATYAYDPLRNVRLVFDVSMRPAQRLEILSQVRTDGLSQARVTALYVRVRPWLGRDVNLQIGRVPTAFGLFGRNGYGSDSALIGRPLAYSYLVSLRADAVPASAADVIRFRGRGWRSSFPRGDTTPRRGLPLVNTDTWDTGAQVRVATRRLEWVGAVTLGSLGNPRVDDDNDGRSLSTRATVRVSPGVVVGASAARGAYLSRTLDNVLGGTSPTTRLTQRAGGLDLELARGRWTARGEVLVSRWALPAFTGATASTDVTAMSLWGEGRLRLWPGLDAALRVERLHFGDIATEAGLQPWEADVTRVEPGLAFTPMRHVRLKVAVQRNRRPLAGRIRHDTLVAAQAALWF